MSLRIGETVAIRSYANRGNNMEIISKYYDSEIGALVKVLKPADPRTKTQKKRPYPLTPRPSYISGSLWPNRAGGIITNNY